MKLETIEKGKGIKVEGKGYDFGYALKGLQKQ